MKRFALYHFSTLLIAVFASVCISFALVKLLPKKESENINISGKLELNSCLKANLAGSESDELVFRAALKDTNGICFMGSSEFSERSKAAPYYFLEDQFGVRVSAFGHAYQQCFNIYAQLLANQDLLENAKVCILLSPGWFETEGSNSQSIIEFVRPNFFNRICDKNITSFEDQMYVGEVLNQNALNFEGTSPAMRYLMNLHRFKESSFLRELVNSANVIKTVNYNLTCQKQLSIKYTGIKWDDIRKYCQDTFLLRSKNNSFYIDSNYYSTHLNTKESPYKKAEFKLVPLSKNREWKDLQMLVKLLKKKNAKASFILQGLNPYHYQHLSDFDHVEEQIKQLCKKNNFAYLNNYTSNPKEFQPGILNDIMHTGDYGWMLMNEFMMKTYFK